MKIYSLVVAAGRKEHIARHGVSVQEVEEIVSGDPFITRSRQGTYRIIGQTNAGRHLTVIVGPRGAGVYGLMTARAATESEVRRYRASRRR